MTISSILGAAGGVKSAIITGGACVALCLPVGYCSGYQAARNKATAERLLANASAQKTAIGAADEAAVERVADALDNAEKQGALTDAIIETPDTAPDAVRVQLGCERLRQQGADVDAISACAPFASSVPVSDGERVPRRD